MSTESKAVEKAKPEEKAVEKQTLESQLLDKAKTPQERELAYSLASAARRTEILRRAAGAIAETSWGTKITPVARQAVAAYALEIGADPVRHIFILGGSPYLNAAYFMDLVAANEDFERDDVRFIHKDNRASAEENAERLALRIQYGVPDDAPGAAIVTLYYKGKGPFIGVNWAGVRANDPVGKDDPTKTSHTRAYRKAAMKAETSWFRNHPKLAAAEQVLTTGKLVDASLTAEELPPDPQAEKARLLKGTETAAGSKTTRHNPSAQCAIEGDHDITECGYTVEGAK